MEENTNIKINDQFDLIVRELNAPETISSSVALTLQSYFDKHAEYKSMIESLEIKDINDTGKMQVARAMRLDLKKKRIESQDLVESERSKIKLRMSDDILQDKIWLKSGQLIKALFENLETLAEEKEKFAENEIKKQKKERADQRRKLLEPYEDYINVMMFDLENMPDETFEITLSGVQHSYNLKQEQIKAEKEKTEKIEKRKNELFSLGLKMIFGNFHFTFGKEMLAITGDDLVNDEKYSETKAEIISTIEAEKQRQIERDAELERITKESKLRTNRLNNLFNTTYTGIAILFDGKQIMTDAELIAFTDTEFEEQIKLHGKRVDEYNKQQERKRLHDNRKEMINPYLKYILKEPSNYADLTDKQFNELYKSVKECHDEEVKLETRRLERQKQLFELGFNYNGESFAIENIAKISNEEIAVMADHVFDVFIKSAQQKIDEAEKRKAEQEKLQTGTDKEKLNEFYNHLKNTVIPVMKNKKTKLIIENFESDFRKVLLALQNDIKSL